MSKSLAFLYPFCAVRLAPEVLSVPSTPYGNTSAIHDKTPGFYVFQQTFRVPGDPGSRKTRTGFVAHLALEPYGTSIVPLQESGGRAQASSVLMLHDSHVTLSSITSTAPTSEFQDAIGVDNKIWHVIDESQVAQITKQMHDQRLVLVHGRASYEAALTAQQESIAAAFLSVHDPGLTALPLHRVVDGKPDFKTGILVMNSRAYFFFQEFTRAMPSLAGKGPHFNSETARQLLKPTDALQSDEISMTAEEAGARVSPGAARNSVVKPGDIVMLAVTSKQTFRLHSQPGWSDHILADIPAAERNVDVVQLHRIILEGVLELPAEEIRAGKYVSYHRDADEAVQCVKRGADVAFIMNAPRLHDLYNLALSGSVLPHNSVEIFPLTNGLGIYELD